MAAAGFRMILLLAACLLPLSVDAMVRHYKFNVGCITYLHFFIMQKHMKFAKHISYNIA